VWADQLYSQEIPLCLHNQSQCRPPFRFPEWIPSRQAVLSALLYRILTCRTASPLLPARYLRIAHETTVVPAAYSPQCHGRSALLPSALLGADLRFPFVAVRANRPWRFFASETGTISPL